MTVQYDEAIRINMPVTLGIYTFTDANDDTAIDLTTDFVATAVYCEIKRKGDAYSAATQLAGAFVSAAAGTVKVTSHTHTVAGVWTYQFYCVNASAAKLWGEPVQYVVYGNVPNMATGDLLTH